MFLITGADVAVIVWWLDLQLPMQQSVPITTDVVSSTLLNTSDYIFVAMVCPILSLD
jgi:hypothetical protein